MKINKEIKFLLFIIFIIFIILLTIILIGLLKYIRFDCNSYLKELENIKYSGTMDEILPYLQSGDIIIKSDHFSKKIESKLDCFYHSAYLFTPKNKKFTHVFLILRKNGIVYGCESSNYSNNKCFKNYSEINKKYQNGVRIFNLQDYINSFKKNQNIDDCKCFFNIRFVNRNLDQKIISQRIENELQILNGINFTNPLLEAGFGWALNDFPMDFKFNLHLLLENKDEGYFCSEFVATILQRVGLMKRKYNAGSYFPAYFSEFLDDEKFNNNTYSKIYSYKI